MFVVQLSDLHIRAGKALAFNVADSATALEQAVDHLERLKQRPDCIVISGDLAEQGDPDAYAIVALALARLSAPVLVLPGNHDNRDSLLAALGAYCPADPSLAPYLCYTREEGPLRLVVVDGIRPGSHAGHLDEPVAYWLEKKLAVRRDAPTLLFTHHPPFLSALGVMDEPYENAKVFARILRDNPQVRLCCGHLHRSMVAVWSGVTALTAPPLVMDIEPDFSSEGGNSFTVNAPGYLIHHLYAGQVNTHFCRVPGDYPFAGPYSFSNPQKW
jgi:3',5'-cyclic AMP phosphodiesterase CpdA